MDRAVIGRYIKPVGIVLALVCVVIAIQKGSKGASALPHPNLPLLGLAVGLFLIHYLLQAIGWHGILRSLGEPVSLPVSMRMWYMSLIARWLPGRIWYSATRLLLAREADISVATVTFGIVFELIYILIGGSIATLLFAGTQMKGLFSGSQGQILLAIFAVALIISVAVMLRPGTLLKMYRFAIFRKAVRRLAGSDISEQDAPVMSLMSSLGLVCYYTCFWIYSGVMFGVLAKAFIPMNAARWLACIPAFTGSWLVGFFSIITPAGIGAREGAMWLMLKPVMPHSQALILAIISRLMMMGTELLSVGLFYIILRGAVRLPVSVGSSPQEEAA